MVTTVDRGRYTCLVDGAPVTAMRARELGRRSVVVGDRVDLVGDLVGGPDALARIVRISERSTVLRRSADDTDREERVIVANAEQLVIVTALIDPPPRTGLIDRCLVAALADGMRPLLCLTKADLIATDPAAADTLLARYVDLGVAAVTTRYDEEPVDLLAALTGRTSVLVGHSGVGKSTLVNRLVPAASRMIGEVSGIGKGRHTSSSAVALPLPAGGWVIDTPGIRSFGLAHVGPAELLAAFPDLLAGAEGCPGGCEHTPAAAECALPAWVATGQATTVRLTSYQRLLASRSGDDQ